MNQSEYKIVVDTPRKTDAPDGRLFFGTDRDRHATVTLISRGGEWQLESYKLVSPARETGGVE